MSFFRVFLMSFVLFMPVSVAVAAPTGFFALPKVLPVAIICACVLYIYFDTKRDKRLKRKMVCLSRELDELERLTGENVGDKKSRLKAAFEYRKFISGQLRRQGYNVVETSVNAYHDNAVDMIGRKKGAPVLLVGCQNWPAGRIVGENYIFELSGAAKAYQAREREDVEVVFFANCPLSLSAKAAAVELGIKAHGEIVAK